MQTAQLTPSQIEFNRKRKERLRRMEARSVSDPGMVLARLARKELEANKSVRVDAWVERQKQIHKQPWFSVEEDLGPVVAPVIHLEDVIHAVARRFKFRRNELLSIRQYGALARARQVAMYLGKHFTKLSYCEMGRRLGRDHSTILHGVKKIGRLRQNDTGLEMDLRMIAASLGTSLD